jgi:hypothetical protein
MTRDFGESDAFMVGAVHEVCNPTDQNMDLYNNGVGRSLAQSSDLSCADLCYNAVTQGNVWRQSRTP